ncbi:MAG: LacI family DNA-binding transcriptional regulator [Flavihumibacter sp.]|nr:LacI family DNA-binding transcriptional regulator [Flavihumibacter sp.]
MSTVSLKDIAEKAGVSVTLVSYVLNNQHENRIKKETADKIRKVAKSLNYQKNIVARSLKTNKTHSIGLIVSDIANPFFAQLARCIEDEADRQGYAVIFGSSDEDPAKFKRVLDFMSTRQVDGLIIAAPAGSESSIRSLKKSKVPFILIDRYFPGISCDYVGLNNFDAAQLAMRQLLSQKKTRIGMLAFSNPLHTLQERTRGYEEALRSAGIRLEKSRVKQLGTSVSYAEVKAAMDTLLGQPKPIDAIFCASNLMSGYCLQYIHARRIKVPDRIALVGFDSLDDFELFDAPYAYIRQPIQQMGSLAIQRLLSKLNGETKSAFLELQAELIVKQPARNPE